MPRFRCLISPIENLPRQQRFWDMVRVNPEISELSLDPFQEERPLLEELRRHGVIGAKAAAENYHIEKLAGRDVWELRYISGKKPTPLLSIRLASPQMELEI